MKKLITVLLLFVALTAHSQILKNSGIIVGVGKGFASYDLPGYCSGVDSPLNHSSSHFKNKIALELGYRFRLEPNNSRFFYDIDLLGRYNKQEYQLTFNPVQYDDHMKRKEENIAVCHNKFLFFHILSLHILYFHFII